MFKKSEPQNSVPENSGMESAPSIPSSSASTKPSEHAVIGSSLVFKGELSGNGNLLIDGRVEGTIDLKDSKLTVGRKGEVKADVVARLITVEGTIEGDLVGEEGVVVRNTGAVIGNITAPRVNLEDGAKFKGSIDMGSDAKSGSSVTPQSVAASKAAKSQGDDDSYKDLLIKDMA